MVRTRRFTPPGSTEIKVALDKPPGLDENVDTMVLLLIEIFSNFSSNMKIVVLLFLGL
jgi:hypothetical protein